MPDSPQGQLLRDVQLSVAKFYLGNLREEVKKGLAEKAAQGGWNGQSPARLCERPGTRTRSCPIPCALHSSATPSNATPPGLVSLKDLANELHAMGLAHVRSGSKVHASSLHGILRNPVYAGFIRFKGTLYEGKHEPLVSLELFGEVQQVFEPNRNGNKEQKHVFALRDFLTCGECGCKITAERQRGHVYYRCTHGKGRELCHDKAYTREELLLEQVASILRSIELGEELGGRSAQRSARRSTPTRNGEREAERLALLQAIAENKARVDRLLDSYLENLIDRDCLPAQGPRAGRRATRFRTTQSPAANTPAKRA